MGKTFKFFFMSFLVYKAFICETKCLSVSGLVLVNQKEDIGKCLKSSSVCL